MKTNCELHRTISCRFAFLPFSHFIRILSIFVCLFAIFIFVEQNGEIRSYLMSSCGSNEAKMRNSLCIATCYCGGYELIVQIECVA